MREDLRVFMHEAHGGAIRERRTAVTREHINEVILQNLS